MNRSKLDGLNKLGKYGYIITTIVFVFQKVLIFKLNQMKHYRRRYGRNYIKTR